MKIVQTDNYGRDYPNEKFVEGLPYMPRADMAQKIADAINEVTGPQADRYYKVVTDDYVLSPGFEP